MNPAKKLLCALTLAMLAACGTPAGFPGAVVAPPVDLAGQWQLDLAGQTSVFALAPSGAHHYRVTQPGSNEPGTAMDATIQQWNGAHYLVVAGQADASAVSVFRVLGATPTSLRIAALDPARTKAVLKAHGLPVARKKLWLYEEIVLAGPAMQAVLAVPAADVFALNESMTLQRLP